MPVRRQLAAVAVAAILASLAASLLGVASRPAPPRTTIGLPSIWVTDDELGLTVNVTPLGTTTTSFRTPGGATSSVAVDPVDGSLWGISEDSLRSGRIVHYDAGGRVLDEIPVATFGALSAEGITLEPTVDGAIWVVDDPDVRGQEPTLHRIDRTGRLLTAIPTASFWPGSESPQDVAHDPVDDTLWITDNAADRVFHVSTDGRLIDSFSTQAGPFVTVETPDGIRNPQAIAVVSDSELLLSSRYTRQLHRVTTSGDRILQTLSASIVDTRSRAIVGAAVSPTTPVTSVRAGLRAVHDALRAADGGTGAGVGPTTAIADDLLTALEHASSWDRDGDPARDGAPVLATIARAVEALDGTTGTPTDHPHEVVLGSSVRLDRAAQRALVELARLAAEDRVRASATSRSERSGARTALEEADAAVGDGDLVGAAIAYERAWLTAA